MLYSGFSCEFFETQQAFVSLLCSYFGTESCPNCASHPFKEPHGTILFHCRIALVLSWANLLEVRVATVGVLICAHCEVARF